MTQQSPVPERHEPASRVAARPSAGGRPWHRRRIWELRPVQDLLALLVVAFAGWLVWQLRAATVPALIALMLAYVFDPLVTRAKQAWGLPRSLTTALCVVLVLTLAGGTLAWLLPELVRDAMALAAQLPSQLQRVSAWLEQSELKELASGLKEMSRADGGMLLSGALDLAGNLATALGSAVFGLASSLFGIATFAYLAVRFPDMPRLSQLIPSASRGTIVELFARFGRAIGGFLRGQVIVAVFTTVGFIAGFSLVGVPHAPLAGVIGGAFSFVPNGQLSGLLMAWLFGILEMGENTSAMAVFLYPALVYAVTQSLETFVITPLVQGAQTRLHPLLVVAALIAGGGVGGLLGVFLAIPAAACAKILWDEVLWPELRAYLESD